MLEKKTSLDQIEITRNGTIQFRIGLSIIDGKTEIDRKWHRSAVEPGADIDIQVAAVNAHLVEMGCDPLDAQAIEKIMTHAKAAWTPDVVAAHKARIATNAPKAEVKAG